MGAYIHGVLMSMCIILVAYSCVGKSGCVFCILNNIVFKILLPRLQYTSNESYACLL